MVAGHGPKPTQPVREAQPVRPPPSPSIIANAVRPRHSPTRSVAAITTWRLEAGEDLQVEVDDGL